MLRDKHYVRLDNGWLFNVTGYQHPAGCVYASLKYIDGKKWKLGYDAAREFLRNNAPELLRDGFICIPLNRVVENYDPQARWAELTATQELSEVLAEAVQLGNVLRELLQIPASKSASRDSEFGITDSLLWSEGHEQSDIDLIVVGRSNAERLRNRIHLAYEQPGFVRPDPNVMTAPYGLHVDNWREILSRKLHMGEYRGRLFSVRAMLNDSECKDLMVPGPSIRATPSIPIEFEVADASDSLLFPAIYRNKDGHELVDYSVIYEGVFRAGETVTCVCAEERYNGGLRRWVVNDSVEFH